jgi:23S rRNA (adenine-N6)-dimethyltransferase
VSAQRPRSPRDARRRSYSQNFLASPALAEQLVRDAHVQHGDLVVEIGAGSGMLTAALARRARRVHAIEIDPDWVATLRRRFRYSRNVRVIEGDALDFELPREPFRVVANLPFSITTTLMHRLLDDPQTPLVRADLLVEWGVARKRAGRPNTVVSAAWAPWWRFRLGRRVPRTAFRPHPRVDAAVLIVERRANPALQLNDAESFAEIVRGLFAGTLAREFDGEQWAALFAAYRRGRSSL